MAEPLWKPADVKKRLNCGLATVYRLAERGVLPTVRIPGTNLVRFKAERIEELLRTWERAGRNGRGRRA